MKRYWIIHPFLFALYPVLALLAANLGGIAPERTIRALVIAQLGALISLIICWVVSKSWRRAALLTSLFLLFFQSYGHLWRWSADNIPLAFTQIQRFAIPFIWLTLLTLGTWFIWFKISDTQNATLNFNLVAIAIILLPLGQAIVHFAQPENDFFTRANAGGEEITEYNIFTQAPIQLPSTTSSDNLPDIYYIVLDAYGRSDTLQELYDYDNSNFINFLEDSGFYVADRGITNYTRTLFALSTSLNGQYLDDVAAVLGPESSNTVPLEGLISNSRFITALSETGYEIVYIFSGYAETSLRNADRYYRFDANGLNDFESLLIKNTPLGPLLGKAFGDLSIYELKRARINFAFEQLGQMADISGPKFIFAHIMTPHPPYVFGENGEEINLPGDPLLHDQLPLEEHTIAYRRQVAYTSQRTQEVIDSILTNAKTPPIIILHGDHGPWVRFAATPEDTCLKERYTILSAYYFPDSDYGRLYETISPVNSFRVVMDQYFSTDMGLVEDKTYYSNWPNLYDFVDVTDDVETCTWNPPE